MLNNNTWNKWLIVCLLLLLLLSDTNAWNHLTVCKQMRSNSFKKNVTYELFAYKLYIYSVIGWKLKPD